ncbi:LysM peptidoglycan-binding domain-containing protein [Consotaella salsifontis]|uniref:Nucleoid-associated protein YgaU, contains BON and LysM domains n=1 Tax=Consotaella salsifontis TaxID=1365950 RepID=A0A1T4SK04_9HYPH|nr:LysM peptidoglycan-binding domain-containing protein [Consotaella salsifontis]SKA28532.1 Nucleoid-associated protein YgaU, contains BON and LysM domains [Consotaella salsifontis]
MKRPLPATLISSCALLAAVLAGYWSVLDRGNSITPRPAADDAPMAASSGVDAPTAGTEAGQSGTDVASLADSSKVDVGASSADVDKSVDKPNDAMPASAVKPPLPSQGAEAGGSAKPRFDLLRVEPDGSTVIAGRAPAGATVVLVEEGRTLAIDKAGPDGDFALVLDQPLATGPHQMRLALADENGATTVLSDDVAVVSVPPRGHESDLLAMIEAPGQPSRLVSVPAVNGPAEKVASLGPSDKPSASSNSPDAATTAEAESSAPLAKGAADSAVADIGAATLVTPTSNPGSANNPASAHAAAANAVLMVEAVEVEGDKMFVAGAAEDGSTVRVYLDNGLLGEDHTSSKRRFLVAGRTAVPVGNHLVRADQIGQDGAVAARVEVVFNRPNEHDTAAVAPGMSSGDDRASTQPDEQVSDAAQSIAVLRQPPLVPQDGRVIIRKGDTLWAISRDTYGLGRRYTVIYVANGDQIRDPDRIFPGQVFRLPVDEGEAKDRAAAVN